MQNFCTASAKGQFFRFEIWFIAILKSLSIVETRTRTKLVIIGRING